jgi:predicted nuclease of restriction endonuclease-like RecB superfamily
LVELADVVAVRPLTPAYVTLADYPWLAALLDERVRFVGRQRREWRSRLSEPLAVSAPLGKLRVASTVLDRLAKDRTVREPRPRELRARVFREAAKQPSRAIAIARTAAQLGLTQQALMDGLFRDLPDERTLAALPRPLDAAELALLCNEAIVAALLYKALRVRVLARGNVRAVVRHAKLMGLLCIATPEPAKDEVTLELTGPYSLFRHTRIYGHALASLVPRLARCNGYRLEADCVLDGEAQLGRLVLRSGDPIAPARELPRFDSQVEERFARAFAKLAREWDLIREPKPLPIGDALIFPDFELHHRATGARWLLEIVGYWTPEYIAQKLSQLRAARLERLIVCIDDARACADGGLDAGLGHVLRYRRHVDPRAVIAIVDPLLYGKLGAGTKTSASTRTGTCARSK